MKIVLGGTSNVYTSAFAINAGVGTLAISGVQGFDMTDSMLDTVWDVTASKFIPCKRVTVAYVYTAGLPVWAYTFYSLPTGVSAGDTLVITIDVPDAYASISIQRYQASKV